MPCRALFSELYRVSPQWCLICTQVRAYRQWLSGGCQGGSLRACLRRVDGAAAGCRC
ncbi:hypothetical protein J2S55_008084 [Streptosporangium brasiliense]|uniref:Uncharacterized protein n=1 Tax=Streptosporangium brasiliense TaxID=47480 RepID=A0ABT9RHQ5_9ACTN|nr:hypothetical protein [Streptosporangium brasiliense]